jgi:hypothetical protein
MPRPQDDPEQELSDYACEMREELIAAYRLRLRDRSSVVIELGLTDDDESKNDEGF